MANKVELVPYVGIDHRGFEVPHDQWHVVLNGKRVGYLSHNPKLRLMPTINLPEPLWEEVCKECENLRTPPAPVIRPIPFYVPDEKALEQLEEEVEE